MEHALHGDVQALLPWLTRHAVRMTRNRDNADDLVQASLERALKGLNGFQPGTNLKSWMYRILRNTHINEIRKQSRWQQTVDIDENDYLSPVAANQDSHLEYLEMVEALMGMSAKDREVLLLVGGQGLSYDEAAEELGVAVGTIRSRLSRARVRLASLLTDHQPQPRAA